MRTLTAFVLFGGLTVSPAAFAQSSDFDIPAHVSRVDGRALIERPDGSEDVERNLTLAEGDRIRTLEGRVEILFADGTLLHLDRRTVIDFQTEDFVRVMEGRARWIVSRGADRAGTARGKVMRVDTPAATLELQPGGDYRIAVAPNGDAELAVRRGEGALLNDQGETPLRAGERAVAAAGRAPSQAFYANAAALDDFDRWSDGQHRLHMSAASSRYLPNEMQPYGYVFDSYGSWRSHPDYGYVWYPVVDASWQPYYHGRWHSYPRYGWTWIGRDPWAWPTHHFGRWGFSAGVWFWIPGRTWGPAWVSWATSRGYVGWSPLGYDDHPIYRINVYSPYSSGYPWCGWTFIRDRHFGGRWSPGDVYVGVGVNVIARGGGITQVASSPVASRAIPRNGVPSGTAVPRGGAQVNPGNAGGEPRARPGGLAGVPTSRPRRIPSETIRSGEPDASDRRVPVARTPGGMAPSAPATREPRAGSREPREGSSAAGTARPRAGSSATPGASGTPQPASPPAAGRPVRPRQSGGVSESSSVPYPYSTPVPRVRESPRDESRPGGMPSRPAPEYREPAREARPRQAERAYDPPAAAEPRPSNGAQGAVSGAEGRERRPAPGGWRAPSAPPPPQRSAPSARPQPPSGGGGQERARGGDQRAPSGAGSNSGRQAQSRRRGGE